MTEQLHTLTLCSFCEQSVCPSWHTPEECCRNLKQQRDEARAVATGLLAHLEAAWEVLGDMVLALQGQQKDVQWTANRFYPWLKQQATVDE